MKPASLGLSRIHTSESRSSRSELLAKVCIFAAVCVLLAIFFICLTGEVQIGTARATHSDVQSLDQSQ